MPTTKQDVAMFGDSTTAFLGALMQHLQRKRQMEELDAARAGATTLRPTGETITPDSGMAGMPETFRPGYQQPDQSSAQMAPQFDQTKFLQRLVAGRAMNPYFADELQAQMAMRPDIKGFAAGEGIYSIDKFGGQPKQIGHVDPKPTNDWQESAPFKATNPKTGKDEMYVRRKNVKTGIMETVPLDLGVATTGGMNAGNLSPDALEMTARTYLATGNLPPMGMGGMKTRADILTKAAELNKAEGNAPNTPALNAAAMSANKKALGNLVNFQQNVSVFVRTASENMDLAVNQAPRVSRTGSPLVNRFVNWANGEVLVGNKELTKLETYIYTAAREYAKVTMGASASAAGLTDTAAREAEKLINAAQTPEAFPAAIGAMKDDMANVTSSYDTQVEELQGRISKLGAKPRVQPGGKNPDSQKTDLKKKYNLE